MAADKKIALVTGASSGIGRASALALVKSGFMVAVTGRREAELKETATLAGNLSANILPIVGDVSDPDSVTRLFETVIKQHGRLDVLFNNAGVAIHGTDTIDLPLDKWEYLMRINVTGAFLCAQQALRIMKNQDPKGGRIINNGSISAHVPRARALAYTVSKHAITGMTKSIALDYRDDNICCSQIDIGNAAVKRTEEVAKGARIQADGVKRAEPQIDVAIVANTVAYIANLPLDVNVPFMTIMANAMPLMGRG
ncbi:2-deoxy-D-gluconate 3-dehydrogenase [uncultured delta proteobacterium]|uniref:2-deoxy-D-gluconate 3-dehydrogenase n=1 Tax=uncultured delta proteobacterium TaxID=34034 RepID=A0A212JX26_9DELT|nr:2-deoxy-D-gluconate 3-dehydrogenase [uncultured delta proteobacterium]